MPRIEIDFLALCADAWSKEFKIALSRFRGAFVSFHRKMFFIVQICSKLARICLRDKDQFVLVLFLIHISTIHCLAISVHALLVFVVSNVCVAMVSACHLLSECFCCFMCT